MNESIRIDHTMVKTQQRYYKIISSALQKKLNKNIPNPYPGHINPTKPNRFWNVLVRLSLEKKAKLNIKRRIGPKRTGLDRPECKAYFTEEIC